MTNYAAVEVEHFRPNLIIIADIINLIKLAQVDYDDECKRAGG